MESTGFGLSKLIKVVIQDQVIFFVAYVTKQHSLSLLLLKAIYMLILYRIILCTVANIFVAPAKWNKAISCTLSIFGTPTLLSVIGCRMLLNLKDANQQDGNAGSSSLGACALSDIRFEREKSTVYD